MRIPQVSKFLSLLFAISFQIVNAQTETLVINEFLAINDNCCTDEFGEFEDWVEIYNFGTNPIDLGGFYLTDDFTTPTKFQIPQNNSTLTTIPPNSFLVFWLDNQPEQGILHANFKLSGSGEQIGIFAPNGSVIDTISFTQQAPNNSFGSLVDGQEFRNFISEPSPNKSNLSFLTEIKEYHIECNADSFAYISENYSQDIYISSTLTYEGQTWNNTRIRIRGDSSREFPKKSLKLKFNNENFVNGRETLNFNADYLDKSYLNSILSSLLMRESGQISFEAEPAKIYLNGEYLGFYIRIENIDNDFLESNILNPNDNLYKATRDGATLSIYDDAFLYWEKKTNDEAVRDDLIKLMSDVNLVSDSEFYNFFVQNTFYDEMINIFAMNILLANGSTYYHNYYLYHNLAENKWFMLPWDMDKSFYVYGSNLIYNHGSNTWESDNPLHQRALINPQIFSDIQNRINELQSTIFNSQHIFPIIDSLVIAFEQPILDDTTDLIENITDWNDGVTNVKNFINDRYNFLQNQFSNYPRPFRANKITKENVNQVDFSWIPSTDPNGDELTYTLKYSPLRNYTSDVKFIYNIEGTNFTLSTDSLEAGDYFWTLYASDGTNTIKAFDTRNDFVIKEGTKIPQEIEGNITFSEANSPYISDQDITIKEGAILNIEAGVSLLFDESVNLIVEGEIHFSGTPEKPIKINKLNSENWGAILLNNSQSSTFNFVEIENASLGLDAFTSPSAVSIQSSNVQISSSTFKNNANSVFANSSQIEISNCVFDSTNFGEFINIKNSTGSVIKDCEFQIVQSGDAIDFDRIENGLIENNSIYGSKDDGIDIGENSENILIKNNFIEYCFDKGISIGEKSTAILERNLVLRNGIGCATKDSSVIKVTNNTFYKNAISLSAFEKNIGFGGGFAKIENSIFSLSDSLTFYKDGLSEFEFSYSLSDLEELEGIGNIFANPQFIEPNQNNFQLLPTSPCINSGNPQSPFDVDGTRIDIGAIPFLDTSELIIFNEINYNPSQSFNVGEWIEFYNTQDFEVDISNWTFTDSDSNNIFTFPPQTILDAKSYLVLISDLQKFTSHFPNVQNFITGLNFNLSNEGERLKLSNALGTTVDSVFYQTSSPWTTEANGSGKTLELISTDLDNSLASSWRASTLNGTPGTENEIILPNSIKIFQNFPNPFNVSTRINFEIPSQTKIKVSIFNILGQKVKTLLNQTKEAGFHTVEWNGTNENDAKVSSGVYFCKVEIGKKSEVRKMLLLK
ncbi:MAG: T9SS C-terminal target domain-containing protein [Calditrichaeota bacterium]|nr:MAG: T9SS C-terminal target domain-containing protein [Calditrichota bacterium]